MAFMDLGGICYRHRNASPRLSRSHLTSRVRFDCGSAAKPQESLWDCHSDVAGPG
jgi:hypothetical protein